MVANHNYPIGNRDTVHAYAGSELIGPFLTSLDTKLARTIKALYLGGSHRELLQLKMSSPSTYTNIDLFRRDYAAISLLSKLDCLDTDVDKKAVALEKFYESELLCQATDRRLLQKLHGDNLNSITTPALLFAAQKKIADLLGPFSWDVVSEGFGFSSGASTRLPRSRGDAYYKLAGTPAVTRRAALAALAAIHSSPSWRESMQAVHGRQSDPFTWLEIVPGADLQTVPKNAKTDRVICIEPDMNMYLQKGFGNYFRSQLKHVGISLDDQTRNQKLARVGSRDGSLATIDLKAASDSISFRLVETLLPREWFQNLDLVRSEIVLDDDYIPHKLVKFSSMGNGYTFELESLIFWALSSACADHSSDRTVSIYGDDIIVATSVAGSLIELLEYCGFSTNIEKTFVSGPFRESCGKHYFLGVDVTPFYVKESISSVDRKFWFANSIRRWAGRECEVADPRYYASWQIAVNTIPKKLRRWIPDGFGDMGLICTFDELDRKVRKKRNGFFRILANQEVTHDIRRVYDLTAYVRAGCCYDFCGEYLSRLMVKRWKPRFKRTVLRASQWTDAPLWPSVVSGSMLSIVRP